MANRVEIEIAARDNASGVIRSIQYELARFAQNTFGGMQITGAIGAAKVGAALVAIDVAAQSASYALDNLAKSLSGELTSLGPRGAGYAIGEAARTAPVLGSMVKFWDSFSAAAYASIESAFGKGGAQSAVSNTWFAPGINQMLSNGQQQIADIRDQQLLSARDAAQSLFRSIDVDYDSAINPMESALRRAKEAFRTTSETITVAANKLRAVGGSAADMSQLDRMHSMAEAIYARARQTAEREIMLKRDLPADTAMLQATADMRRRHGGSFQVAAAEEQMSRFMQQVSGTTSYAQLTAIRHMAENSIRDALAQVEPRPVAQSIAVGRGFAGQVAAYQAQGTYAERLAQHSKALNVFSEQISRLVAAQEKWIAQQQGKAPIVIGD